jgi:hypothetical protein
MAVHLFGIDGDNNALAAEHLRGFPHKSRRVYCCGIDGNLVGSGPEKVTNILGVADTAAHREGHENLLGGPCHDVENDTPVFVRRSNIEKAELVRALAIVNAGNLDRVTGVPEIQELDAFDYPAGFDIETRDDALGKHTSQFSQGMEPSQ